MCDGNVSVQGIPDQSNESSLICLLRKNNVVFFWFTLH